MSPSRIIRRSLIAFSAAFFTLLGTLAAASTAQAALPPPAPSSMVSLTASLAPAVPSGTTRLGALAPDTKLSIEVALNIPDQGALTAFLTGLSEPDSPDYQHFLRPGQFGPMFGPSLAQVAAVENALKSAGLTPGQVSANRLAIPVTASAAAIERAFGITLASYRLPGGRDAYANTAAPQLSAAVAPLIQGVLGLDDIYQVQHL
jgi:kumamolisin